MPSVALYRGSPKGYQQLLLTSGSAQALTLPTPSANGALMSLELSGDIRWRDDGVAPTTTVGNLLSAGSYFEIMDHATLANFQAIAVGASVNLNVNYYHKN